MKLRHFAVFGGIFTVIICLLLFLFIVTADDEESGSSSLDFSGLNLSAEVLKHQPTVEKYAKEYGISDYVNYLLALMQVESGGTGTTDVMQASESLGLPLNSLSVEDSIKQGCKYFSELLKSAEAKGCDINTVVQSYNYGGGFIDYVSSHGKKYTFELAVSFAKDKSGGVKVTYKNEISIQWYSPITMAAASLITFPVMGKSTPLSWRSVSQRTSPAVSKSPIRMRFP